MNKGVLFLIATSLVLACNDTTLVGFDTPTPGPTPTPTASIVVLPSPVGTPPVALPTVTGCGNANYQVFDSYDEDDPPGEPDSYWCYWICAIDLGDWLHPADPNPPHEVLKRYDYDAPSYAYQVGPTIYLPCYSAYP